MTAERVRFRPKTIERWFYTARDQQDPIKALERRTVAEESLMMCAYVA